MSDASENEMHCTSPELMQTQDLIPAKSRKTYDFTYRRFLNWAEQHGASHYSENVLLAYFNHLSNNEKMKSSTLFAQYSMLKAELHMNHNIQLKNYTKLLAFLKIKNSGYKPKKTKTLLQHQVDNFLHSAPNEKYLATKVILILGVCGGCRCEEMTYLKMGDIKDLGSAIIVKVKDIKNHKWRSFTILPEFYLDIFRKYISVRKDIDIDRFLLKYHDGKCAKMVMGKHKIGSAPRDIASFLKLPNCNEYTGHCLRLTSATLLKANGGWVGWHSTVAAEGHAKDSIENEKQTEMKILTPLDINKPSTSDNLDSPVDFTSITDNIATGKGLLESYLRQSEVYLEDNSDSLLVRPEDLEFVKTEPDDGETSTKLESDATFDDDSDKYGEELNGHKRQACETNSDCETAKRTKLSDSDEADLNFFKSLLPDIRKMDGNQRNKLKIAILNAIDNILYKA